MSCPFDNCVFKTEEVKHKPDIFASFGQLMTLFPGSGIRTSINVPDIIPPARQIILVRRVLKRNFWEKYGMRSRMKAQASL
jgi:hypothetical protein